jgi:hypothetical protein
MKQSYCWRHDYQRNDTQHNNKKLDTQYKA